MDGFFSGSTLAASREPPSLVARCGACGLHKGCSSPKIPVTGQGRLGVLVVAEAPGKLEDERNDQLVGDAGQLLRVALRKLDVDLDRDCWKTNAIICRPPNDRIPTNNEVDYCRPNLNQTLKELKPRIVLMLGGAAVRVVVAPLWREDDVGGVGRWVGYQIPCQATNAWLCPSYNPSHLLRDKRAAMRLWFNNHLEAAFDLKGGRPWEEAPDWRKEVRCVMDVGKAAAMLDKMVRLGGMVSFDYETNCLKPDGADARIVSCAVAWGRKDVKMVVAYPWVGQAIEATSRLLRSPLPKVAANMKFEERWTRAKLGHGVRNWAHDTMQAAHVMDNRPGVTSLKFQSFVYLGMGDYDSHIKPFLKAKSIKAANRILTEVAMGDLLLYNGLDALVEFKLAVRQRELMGLPEIGE